MKLQFLGAAGTVTGSRYLLQSHRSRVLVDCGLFQGCKQLRLRNWAAPPFDPGSIDAVVLTHAHIDHSGYLPALVQRGFRGPIYCSAGTHALCKVLLPDSAHLQEEEARFANRHGFSKHRPALPLYSAADAELCLTLFREIQFEHSTSVAKSLRIELFPAGHLLGASLVRVEADGISLTFTGDLGRPNDPLMMPPAVPPPTDYLVIESTYGDRTHPAADAQAELAGWLAKALSRGGTVVVPAFSVGRTQALLLYIARLKQKQAIADVPVFMDSPMAIDATSLYAQFRSEHRLDEQDCRRMCQAAQLVTTRQGSKALDRLAGPAIILSASGMATGGRVLHHLKAFAGDARNLILFSGYQTPGTRGWSLVHGAEFVRIHGEEVPVRAEVAQLEASSAHSDAGELLAWMTRLAKAPQHTFVTHGEPSASEALRYRIAHELGWPVTVPEHCDAFEFTPMGFSACAQEH
ncbi:MAG: MBL fold metallo-hydrolase [Steroidobacteraceae bacterium]